MKDTRRSRDNEGSEPAPKIAKTETSAVSPPKQPLTNLAVPPGQPPPLTASSVQDTPLRAIGPIIHRLSVVGKITNMTAVRDAIISMEKTKLLAFDIADSSGSMGCVAYGPAANHVNNLINVGDTIRLGAFMLRPINKNFSASDNLYEIVLDMSSVIAKVELKITVPTQTLNYINFADIHMLPDKKVINTKGVIKKINPPVERTSRSGGSLLLTNVLLLDENRTSMMLSLWNERGSDFDYNVDDELYIKNCRIHDYSGVRSIMAITSTEFSLVSADTH